jgi:pimeloyl-ACP methyl ester carboxylesterase
MDHVFTARAKRGDGFSASPGPVRFLAVPTGASVPQPAHQMRKADWFRDVMAAAGGVSGGGIAKRGDVVIYVHGFNTAPGDMLARLRKLKVALAGNGYRGTVIGFDWPSAGRALNYLEDRKDAKATALALVDEGIATFAALQRPDCPIDVHVLAHSMGCYVVREAFDDADDRPAVAARSWSVSQVMLVAADLSVASLSAGNPKSSSLYRHAVRVTHYHNPLDEVLSLSAIKRVGVSPRSGRVGMDAPLPPKAIDIYCGARFRAVAGPEPAVQTGHVWYFDDKQFLNDVALTVGGRLDRHEFPTRAPTDRGGLALRP